MSYRLGIDVGGTFTDLVLALPSGDTLTRKVLSATDDYATAMVAGTLDLLEAAGIGADAIDEVLHETTVATNAILERRGAPTGLLTTDGFRDVLEIGRLRLARLYDIDFERPAPLVPRRWRQTVTERLDYLGEEGSPASIRRRSTRRWTVSSPRACARSRSASSTPTPTRVTNAASRRSSASVRPRWP